MADKTKRSPPEERSTNPPGYRESGPIEERPGHHSFTLSMFAEIQRSLGALTADVGSLKEQSNKHSEKLEKLGNDVHAAKVGAWIIAASAAFLGYIIRLVFDYMTRTPLGH